jgi:hypothetical protein
MTPTENSWIADKLENHSSNCRTLTAFSPGPMRTSSISSRLAQSAIYHLKIDALNLAGDVSQCY